MLKKLINTLRKRETPFGNFGILKLYFENYGCYWFGRVNNISPNNHLVELTIRVDDEDEPLTDKVKIVTNFAINYDAIMSKVFMYLNESLTDIEEMRSKHYLESLELNNDNKTWMIGLASLSNSTKLPVLLELKENTITWCNIVKHPS